jgi:hypothetical protein
MVEADSHLKLLPTSTSDIYKVFEHIDMLSIGIRQQPYTVIPILLGSDFGVLCHLGSQKYDYVMVEADNHLKLFPTSILHIHNVFEHIDMCDVVIAVIALVLLLSLHRRLHCC